jgi:hypothetical protein
MAPPLKDQDVALFLRLRGNSYSEIGHVLGVTRQRIQQMLAPAPDLYRLIVARGACEACSVPVKSGHVHHRSTEVPSSTYNAESNLALLCAACHRVAHADPVLREKRRPRTPEEVAEIRRLQGYRLGSTRTGIPIEEYRAHRENGERWCGSCAQWVKEQDFSRNRSTSSGFGGRCAACNRRQSRAYARRSRAGSKVA